MPRRTSEAPDAVQAPDGDGAPGTEAWVAAVEMPAAVELPDVGPADRAAFGEWLWMRFGDARLIGIDEGSIDVTEAVAAGLERSALVLDAAAAPTDRDWVAAVPGGRMELAFGDERSCREAVAVLAGIAGVRAVARRGTIIPVEPQQPLAVSGFGWILPPGGSPPVEAASPGPGRVVIDAGCGFGTGLHPTTRLCLRALAGPVAAGGPPARVLDVGAGSGILGIAAATLGATRVDCVEIDDRVHDAIRRNAAASGVAPRIHVTATIAGIAPAPPPYDLVMANIVAGVLLDLAATLAPLVGAGGRLILSGVRADEASAVADRYASLLAGRTPPRLTAEDEWCCLVFER